jgi:hypothetical protein
LGKALAGQGKNAEAQSVTRQLECSWVQAENLNYLH